MSQSVEQQFVGFLGELLPEINQRLLFYYRQKNLGVETKQDQSPVTIADKETERALRKAIRTRFPDHAIRGEEHDDEPGDSDYSWIIDPIDGTKAFITGCPLFGTLIGLLHKGIPVCGSISFPVLNEWIHGDGTTSWSGQDRILASNTEKLEKATVMISDPRLVRQYQPNSRFDELWKNAPIARTWGDCYGYFLVATGKADIMMDPVLSPWDILPLIPVLHGAGAVITDWQGNSAVSGSSALACNPLLHRQVLPYTKG
jgi:histidinol phosphatase-like enzyme (inositol monophosphatase family)